MAGKKKQRVVKEESATDQTAAANAATLRPQSKLTMMAQVIQKLAGMKEEDLSHFLTDTLAQVGHEADAIDPSDAEKNKASIAAKTVAAEEIAKLFGGDELSEEFREKAETLFESAVQARVTLELAEAEDHFNTILSEQTEQITSQLIEQVDKYLTYVAEHWVKENEVALESTFRTEISENFINGLKDLFKSHYIQVPDDQVDVVAALSDQVNDLEEQLNSVISENIELKEEVTNNYAEDLFESMTQGMSAIQKDKFATLAESIEFDGDVEKFQRKLNIIKEHHFKPPGSGTRKPNMLVEESDEELNTRDDKTFVDPSIKSIHDAISNTVRRS